MVLEHIAAVLLFSGPLLYIGLWLMIDPAGILALADVVGRITRWMMRSAGEVPASDATLMCRRRNLVRWAGVGLVIVAVVL